MANSFRPPKHESYEIIDNENKLVGCIRIKPNSISWCSAKKGKWHTISLADFAAYMEVYGFKQFA